MKRTRSEGFSNPRWKPIRPRNGECISEYFCNRQGKTDTDEKDRNDRNSDSGARHDPGSSREKPKTWKSNPSTKRRGSRSKEYHQRRTNSQKRPALDLPTDLENLCTVITEELQNLNKKTKKQWHTSTKKGIIFL